MGLKINIPVKTHYDESNSVYARIDLFNVNRMMGILECGVSYFMSKEDADAFKVYEHNTDNPLKFQPNLKENLSLNHEDLMINVDGKWQLNKLPYNFSALLNEETTEVRKIKVKTLVETVVPEINFDDEGNQFVEKKTKNIIDFIDKNFKVKVFKVDYTRVDDDLIGYSYELLEKIIVGLLPGIKIEKCE